MTSLRFNSFLANDLPFVGCFHDGVSAEQEIGAAYKQAMRLAYQHDASWLMVGGVGGESGRGLDLQVASWLEYT